FVISTLSLHDALPISGFISLFNEYICFAESFGEVASLICIWPSYQVPCVVQERLPRLQCILCVQQVGQFLILDLHETKRIVGLIDRKSTRLNSSHDQI